jgi:FMN-dependent NADH-azoreductase
VVYTRGSRYLEGTSIPPSFDHQAPYLDFWLRLVGVRDLRSVIVDNAWNQDRQQSEISLRNGKAALKQLVEWFLKCAGIDTAACSKVGTELGPCLD